jgi:hypothetical protein
MHPTPARRKLIAILLLLTGLVGAAMRWIFAAPSLAHDIGTLLMVMWVPAVGNIIGYLIRRWGPRTPLPPSFGAGQPFVTHAVVELTLDSPHRPRPGDRLVLLVGQEAFSARCVGAAGEADAAHAADAATPCELQFLVPEAALPRFAAHTAFQVLDGHAVVGRGRVLERRDVAGAATTPSH